MRDARWRIRSFGVPVSKGDGTSHESVPEPTEHLEGPLPIGLRDHEVEIRRRPHVPMDVHRHSAAERVVQAARMPRIEDVAEIREETLVGRRVEDTSSGRPVRGPTS